MCDTFTIFGNFLVFIKSLNLITFCTIAKSNQWLLKLAMNPSKKSLFSVEIAETLSLVHFVSTVNNPALYKACVCKIQRYVFVSCLLMFMICYYYYFHDTRKTILNWKTGYVVICELKGHRVEFHWLRGWRHVQDSILELRNQQITSNHNEKGLGQI